MQSLSKIEGQVQGQAPIPVEGATQLIYAKKSGSTLYSNYSEFQSKVSGAIQIVFGVLMIVTNIILVVTDYLSVKYVYDNVPGIWGGVIFIASGSVGIAASNRKTKCLAITYMIMCIVSALVSIPVIVFDAFGVAYAFACRDFGAPLKICTEYGQVFAESFFILLLVFSVLGGISAIWGSTLCCKAAACCSDVNEELVPMQIVTADDNQKTQSGNSTSDYVKSSSVESYEKLPQGTSDEVYDTIEDDDVKDDPDASGYEKYQQPATSKDNDNVQQNSYEKCSHDREDQLESSGVAGYDKLMDNQEAKDDYVRYEKPVNDYLVLEADI